MYAIAGHRLLALSRPRTDTWSGIRMRIGPFSFAWLPLVLFLSIAVAFVLGRKVARRDPDIDKALLWTLAAGFGVARVWFVLRYLPAYKGHVISVLDIRDLGFDAFPGLIAGACVALWFVLHVKGIRRAMVVALVSGAVAWSAASAAVASRGGSDPMPAISLADMSGRLQPLKSADGEPTVINLWATWCPPCQAEMPVLAAAQADNPHLHLIFANQGETQASIEGYLASHGLQIKNVLLDSRLDLAKAVDAAGYPTTLFYDGHGRLVATHLGPFSKATFQQALENFYQQASAAP